MIDYKVGEYYTFIVTGLNNNRIFLEDENGDKFSVYAYDFQSEWDWASPQVSEVLKCYVKEKYESGHLILQQSRDVLLITLYNEAYHNEEKICNFIVERTKTIGATLFYIVVDAFGVKHMYKPRANQQLLQPGDEIELNVKSINFKDNNKSYLVFDDITSSANEAVSVPSYDEIPVGEFGEETDKREFKSTIVYPANANSADIDTQMKVILRTIAGFMNAKGGTIYLGVNDNGDAIGIENEYSLLNTSNSDKYTYQQNKDGYENKIRSGVNYHLGPVAQDYVTIKFEKHGEHTVCIIEIEASEKVIWYDEREAYKRMGNRTSHLRSDAIVKLVLDKGRLSRPLAFETQPTAVQTEDEILPVEPNVDSATEVGPSIIKATRPSFIRRMGEQKQGYGSFYMNMFANGDWSWSKEPPTDTDLEFCIPINSPASQNDLIMIYEDGCVNRVDAYHLHLNKTENKRYMNGRRNDGVALVKVFHAKKEDLLACFSKLSGHECIKVHPVSHVSQHDNMGLKGNRVINTSGITGVTEANISFVAAEHDHRVSVFKKTENQLSNSLGIQMDLPRNSRFLLAKDTLVALCDIPA